MHQSMETKTSVTIMNKQAMSRAFAKITQFSSEVFEISYHV